MINALDAFRTCDMSIPRLLLLLFLFLPAPSVGAADRVTFGLREAAPLVYSDKNGQLAGVEYELLSAIFRAADLEMDAYIGSNARLMVAANGAAIAGFAPVVGEAPPEVLLTDSYITYQNVAVTLTGRAIKLQRPSDLSRWRVLAFQRASKVLGAEFADAVATSPSYREEPTQALQARGLLYGRYDVVVGEVRVMHYHVAQVLLESNGGVRQPLPIDTHYIFAPTHYRAGFRDAALVARFNEGLRRIRADGSYDAILARYNVTQ